MSRFAVGGAWLRWLTVPWSETTLAVTIVAASAAPVFLVASADIWRAAAEDDVAARAVETASPDRNGLDITYEVAYDIDGVAAASDELADAIEDIPELAPLDRTIYTLPGLVTIGPPVRQVGPTGRLLAREGALDAIEIVEQLDDTSGGVWVSTWFAEHLDLALGDGLGFEAGAIVDEQWNDIVRGGGAGSVFRIVGLYEPLWSTDPAVELNAYWKQIPPQVVPRFIQAFNGPNSALILTEEATLLSSGLTGAVHWRAPLASVPSSFDGVRELRDELRRIELALVSRGELADAIAAIATPTRQPPVLSTDWFDTTAEIERATQRLVGPLGSARAVGAILGLGGMAAVGLFFMERRRSEFRLLASEGESWPTMSGRVAAQLALPAVAGAAVGVAAAVWGLWCLGPADRAEFESVPWSAVVVVAVLGWCLAAVTCGVASARTLLRPHPAVVRAAAGLLAATLVVAAGFTWVQIGRTESSDDVDLAVVMLPVLAVLVAVTATIAVVGLVLRRAGPASERLPVTWFLAMRRLATGARGVRVAAGAVGLGVGLLVFAVALTSTLDRTVDVKLATEVGGESTLTLLAEPQPDVALPAATTLVRTLDTVITPGSGRVRVVAIDIDTWADAVTWPKAFGSGPDEVLRLLDQDLAGAVPVIAVEGDRVPTVGAFGLNQKLDYQVVGRVASMPGAGANASTLLAVADALDRFALDDAGVEQIGDDYQLPTSRFRRRLVSQAPAEDLVAVVEAAELSYRDVVSRAERSREAGVLAARSAFGYLGVLGVTAATAALVALGLHLAARRRVRALGSVMVRSMGMPPARAAWITVIEFVAVLTIAIVAALIAVPLVVRRLSPRFDPSPDLPPAVEVTVEWLALIGIASACAAVVGLAVWWVEWRDDRHSAGEVFAMSDEPILRCDHLVKFYDTPSGRVQAVRGVDIELSAGVTAAVVGPSGSGKSSLLRMLAGLDEPTGGVVLLEGVDIWRLHERSRARRRAQLLTHIYQRPGDNLFAHLTAAMQLRRLAPRGRAGDETIGEWLDVLGLAHRRDHTPDAMSGGERQRLAFARAAVAGHRLVIADEPTSQLDSESARSVMAAVDHLADRGVTVVFATHDRRVLDRVDQVIALRDGAVATVTTGGSELAVIDRSGRLQLPPELQERFPERRVRLVWDDDAGGIGLERP